MVSDDQQRALKLDSMRSSHPIQVPIAKAEEVEQEMLERLKIAPSSGAHGGAGAVELAASSRCV